jgi:hypothetical protein
MKMMWKILGLGAALLVAAPLAQAQPADGNDKMAPKTKPKAPRKAPAPKGTAYLRVLHAIPDGPNADVYVDGQKVLSDVAFKSVSEYLSVPSGKRSLKITASGKTEALLQGSATVGKDKYYTAAAYGTAAKPALLVQNESTGKDVAGKARVRAFDLVHGEAKVDITVPSTRSKAGYTTLFSALAPGKTSARTVKADTVTLQVRADGKLVKELPNVQWEAGKKYAIFAVGLVGANGPQALDVIVKPAAVK